MHPLTQVQATFHFSTLKTFVMKTLSHTLLSILFPLLVFSCASRLEETPQAEITRLDKTRISENQLTHQVQALVGRAQVHGLALAVFTNNQLTYQNTFGYSRLDTKTPLTDSTNIYGASLSKAVFGVLVMQLVEEGILDLDTPLVHYLPKKIWEYKTRTRWHDNFDDLKQDSLYHKITARMCLSHTSGFPNWR